jgi:hypothetical protein
LIIRMSTATEGNPANESHDDAAPQPGMASRVGETVPDGTVHTFAPAAAVDSPVSEDQLGFSPYARALSRFLLNADTKGPLTVSIEGEWGSGKSSFLHILQKYLVAGSKELSRQGRAHNVPLVTTFNPWRHDKDEALWAAFAMSLTKEIVRQQPLSARLSGHWRLLTSRFQWKRGWLELLKALTSFLVATGLLLSLLALTAQHGPSWLLKFAQNVNISSDEKTDSRKDSRAPESSKSDSSEAKKATTPLARPESRRANGPEWATWLSGFGFFGVIAGYMIALLTVVSKLKILLSAPLATNLSKHMKSPDYASRVSFIEEFHEDFKRVVDAFARRKTVFAFVDDLDRCSVPRASDLMQAISLMLSTDLTNIVLFSV